MEQISLDNFRVFMSPVSFDLAPVTVLTGKNNSGKSSLIKSFLVLADYLEQDDQTVLRLDGRRMSRHRISDWSNLVNWEIGDSFSLLKFSYVRNGIEISYEFEFAGDGQPAHLLQFRLDVPGVDRLTLRSIGGGQGYLLDVSQKLIDYLTGGTDAQQRILEAAGYAQRIAALEQELRATDAALAQAQQRGGQIDLQDLLQSRQQAQNALRNLHTLAGRAGATAGIFFQAEVWTTSSGVKPTIQGLIQAALHSYVTDHSLEEDEDKDMDDEADDEKEPSIRVLDEDGDILEENLEQARYSRREELAEQHARKRNLELSRQQQYRMLVQFSEAIADRISFAVAHLGANRTHQARLYLTGAGNSEISTIADNFLRQEIFEGGAADVFLTKWLQKFNIGERAAIESVDNAAIRIGVVKNGRTVNLADLGFGAGQVLTVLLQVAALIQAHEMSSVERQKAAMLSPTLVLIEEPEANLHPQFQSMLAELFTSLAQAAYGLQFVLETHSEYLIRKLQLLVATQQCAGKDVALYYLDENRKRHIHILPDGKLSEAFGSGFFDEAGEETLALHRIQRKNLHS